MRWITAGLITALMVAGCGGSSSSTPSSSSQAQSSPSSQAQVPTLQYTSGASVAIFADVSSQDAGDTACTTQQSQLIQQVKQIQASLPTEKYIAGQVPTGVLVAFEYGSPTFPSQMLSAYLGVVAAGPPLTSAFTNMADTGDQYNHASVVICVVNHPILSY